MVGRYRVRGIGPVRVPVPIRDARSPILHVVPLAALRAQGFFAALFANNFRRWLERGLAGLAPGLVGLSASAGVDLILVVPAACTSLLAIGSTPLSTGWGGLSAGLMAGLPARAVTPMRLRTLPSPRRLAVLANLAPHAGDRVRDFVDEGVPGPGCVVPVRPRSSTSWAVLLAWRSLSSVTLVGPAGVALLHLAFGQSLEHATVRNALRPPPSALVSLASSVVGSSLVSAGGLGLSVDAGNASPAAFILFGPSVVRWVPVTHTRAGETVSGSWSVIVTTDGLCEHVGSPAD